VDAIGRPHFSSDNGGFWHPDLVERKCCETAGPTVRRDVTVRVSETWGRRDVPPIGGSVTFSATGGQIQVILSPEVQRKLGMTPAERYIWADEPGVDFAVGDDLLFLLDVEGIDGLYHGRLGEMRAYVPAAHNAYVYRITGDTAVNVGYPGLDAPVGRLRAVVDRSLGTRAGELPPEGFTPSEPHSD
jgi:hypothetical protein